MTTPGTSPGVERRRRDQLAIGVGTALAVLGLAGVVVSVVNGHASGAAGSVLFLLVGVVALAAGLRALPRDTRSARGADDRQAGLRRPPPPPGGAAR